MRRLLFILALTLTSVLSASSAPSRWESVDMPARVASVQRPAEGNIDIAVADGYIYIASSRSLPVKVFTILGQLINQDTIPSGTYRLRIAARGVYILKAGESTVRITI